MVLSYNVVFHSETDKGIHYLCDSSLAPEVDVFFCTIFASISILVSE